MTNTLFLYYFLFCPESEQQKKFQEKQQRRLVRQNQVHGEKQNESTENVEQLEDDDSEMQI